MTIHYEYDADTQIVTVRPRGVLGLSDILGYLNRLGEDQGVGGIKTEIVFFEDVSDFTITYSEIEAVRAAYEQIMARGKGLEQTIFVAPRDIQYGIARMVGGIFGDRFEVRAVRTVDEISGILAPDTGQS